jgi:hypothetical protein
MVEITYRPHLNDIAGRLSAMSRSRVRDEGRKRQGEHEIFIKNTQAINSATGRCRSMSAIIDELCSASDTFDGCGKTGSEDTPKSFCYHNSIFFMRDNFSSSFL